MEGRLSLRFLLMTAIVALPLVATAETPLPPGQHPLDPELDRGKVRLDAMRAYKDYSCTFTKRERIDGELLEHEQMFLKVRHEPFSVYMYFLAPKKIKGQQAVYVEGQNDNKLIAQPVGLLGIGGPYALDPNGRHAMKNQRYPITDTGMVRLTEQLLEEGTRDRKFSQVEVKYFRNARVDDRTCTVTQITHPQLPQFEYYMARIFVDDELDLPIRFESYLWPKTPNGDPLLLEEYTYSGIKLNNGFTDADFKIQSQ